MINGKKTFLVHWKDNTTTREPAENISEYAKSQYFVNLRKNKNKRVEDSELRWDKMHVDNIGEFMCDSLTGSCRKQYYYWKCHVEENGVDVHQFLSQSLLLLGNSKIQNLSAQPI